MFLLTAMQLRAKAIIELLDTVGHGSKLSETEMVLDIGHSQQQVEGIRITLLEAFAQHASGAEDWELFGRKAYMEAIQAFMRLPEDCLHTESKLQQQNWSSIEHYVAIIVEHWPQAFSVSPWCNLPWHWL